MVHLRVTCVIIEGYRLVLTPVQMLGQNCSISSEKSTCDDLATNQLPPIFNRLPLWLCLLELTLVLCFLVAYSAK